MQTVLNKREGYTEILLKNKNKHPQSDETVLAAQYEKRDYHAYEGVGMHRDTSPEQRPVMQHYRF